MALRQEKAELLGFPNFAEVSMASKVGGLLSLLNFYNKKEVKK